LAESPAYNKTIFEHAPNSRGAQDYDSLLDELLADGFIKIKETEESELARDE
jgi:chromosome partitioning protein